MAKMCDICGIRPATLRVQVTTDGETEQLDLCEVDYERLAARQRASSPLESLFGGRRGSLFEEFFGDDFFSTPGFGSGLGRQGRVPEEPEETLRTRRGGDGDGRGRGGVRRGGGAAGERLSDHAIELLQAAARAAAERGRTEVDTEHLLMALLDSEVVKTLLGQFKVSLDDLRRQLDEESPRGEGAAEEASRDRRVAAGQERDRPGHGRLARSGPFLRRPGAPADRPCGRAGQHRGRRAAAIRRDAAGVAAEGRESRGQGRGGRPRRHANRHAQPRQVRPRPHRPWRARASSTR